MRAHVIENGTVANTIMIDSLDPAVLGEDFAGDLIDADQHGGGIGWSWDGATLSPPPMPVPDPSAADVLAERARRLAMGFDYDFGDARGVHRIGTTNDDMAKWTGEVSPAAQAAINLGAPEATIAIVTDTSPVTVTAMEWQQILIAARDARQPIFTASFALLAMNPIPADYADDVHWP